MTDMEIEYADKAEEPRGSLRAPEGYGSPWLRGYQNDASFTLFKAISRHKMVLDASDTGLGKTWVALDVMKRLGWNFGVVCPASVVTKWERTAAESPFDLAPEFVISYDKMRTGGGGFASRLGRGNRTWFQWNTVDKVIVIFDEVHVCSNHKTVNSRLLMAAIRDEHIKVIGLSATTAESPLSLRTTGYGLGLHNYADWWDWCLKCGCIPGPFGGMIFNTGTPNSGRILTKNQTRARSKLNEIHQRIFPSRGCRVQKSQIADQLPDNVVIAEEVDVNLSHPMIKDEVKEVDRKDEEFVSDLVSTMRDRQRLELSKVPIFLDRMEELLSEGNSVIIFVNFTKSIDVLRRECKKRRLDYTNIVGGMGDLERKANIAAFQMNHRKICICQSEAGSSSIDLDDYMGESPRCVLISPTYSAKQLLQMLGRAHRMTTKTKVIQWILFATGTVEERACRIVQHKLNNLSLLNDGDLTQTLKVV